MTMRNKRTAFAGLAASSSSSGPQFRSAVKQEEESSSSEQNTPPAGAAASFPSPSLSSFSSKRAADMLATYTNAGLEFGSGGGESSGNGSAPAKNSTTGSALLSEIREGAERLANELDEYLARGGDKSLASGKDAAPLSDEAVADVQLATARKLREVSVRIYCFSCLLKLYVSRVL